MKRTFGLGQAEAGSENIPGTSFQNQWGKQEHTKMNKAMIATPSKTAGNNTNK